jgi:hypothetical protein
VIVTENRDCPAPPTWVEILDGLPENYREHLKGLAKDPQSRNSMEYGEAQAHLESLMGSAILSGMWTVSIQMHHQSGLWMVSGATWGCLRRCSQVEIESVQRVREYSGILGYFQGWPIILGPAPRYGAKYVLVPEVKK